MLSNSRRQSSKQVEVDAGLPWNKKMKVDLGTETESEMQLKQLLDKQLGTDYSMKEHLLRQRQFTNAGSFTTIPAEMTGTRSTQEIQDLEKIQERTLHLKCCGLTDEEIEFYVYVGRSRNSGNVKVDPMITRQMTEAIEAKMRLYEASRAESGSGLKLLGRHQMELEKSLYQGCTQKDTLKQLVGLQTVESEAPFLFVAQMAKRLSLPLTKSKKYKKKEEITVEDCPPVVRPNPSVWHVVVPLDVEEIAKNRLTMDEIRKFPRFKDYEPGVASKVLYVKNLHPKVHVEQLIALFGRFDVEDAPVAYRLLSGRLRGQAFVTFKDSETAEAALKLMNGYVLKGRPVILEFGKCREGS